MTVLIYKLDSDGDAISQLQEGEHIIGRGPLLQCEDRRVSRNHGIIIVTQDVATITSTHINPCFYQAATGKTISILTKGNPMHISDGDKFALLPDQFWYRIKLEKVKENDEVVNEENNKLHVIKQEDEDNQLPTCSKTVMSNGQQENVKKKEQCKNSTSKTIKRKKEVMSSSDSDTPSSSTKKKAQANNNKPISTDAACHEAKIKNILFSSDEDDSIEIKTHSSNSTNVQKIIDINKDETIKPESTNDKIDDIDPGCSSSTVDINKAGPSDTNKKHQKRDRCWYGMECYRKNQAHYKEFSHPGDSDYNSDLEDDRPTCSFGANCFRRNKDHRRQYKHPKNSKKPPGTKNDTIPKKKRPRKQQLNETPEDDYDLDDPFIGDSGSEFEAYSDSEDSDSDFSAGSEEETKRLLKEAKRFTRGKKKDQYD